MYDSRYHAVSLIAVLVALVLGLLLGVAIGDKNLVSSAERNLRADVRAGLSADLKAAGRQVDTLSKQLTQRNELEEKVYPLLVGGQLEGVKVGFVFFGGASQDLTDQVQSAVRTAGGLRLPSVVAIPQPVDLAELGGRALGTRYATVAGPPVDLDLVESLGFRLGAQYVLGGKLLGRERTALFNVFNGRLEPLDAVVIARSKVKLSDSDQAARDRFEQGFVAGARAADVPVVGVETTDASPSQVSWYRQRGMSSVDDLDDIAGRIALVFALQGADGQFGRKRGDQLLPEVVNGVHTTTP